MQLAATERNNDAFHKMGWRPHLGPNSKFLSFKRTAHARFSDA